ncbi:MAG: type II toxin-antitoxin system RelE/ParE family toxin, partial [Bryobacteraceae bacterium]|nr:type II toxin-antitoxin system RelE/ParE family toxin [Bryobacteraceae bacterium]
MATNSSKWTIEVGGQAGRQIDKLPEPTKGRVLSALLSLEENPFPSGHKKLHGQPNWFRLRVGDYRIVYRVLLN